MEDEIVFLQPLGFVRLDQRGSGALQFLLDDAGGEAFEVRVPDPAAGKLYQLVPVAGKRQLEDHADHAVIEVLDVSLKALTAFEDKGFEGLFDRRTLVANVSGGEVLEAGVDGAGAKNAAKLVEANFLANVKLDHHQHGAAEGGGGWLGGYQSGQSLGGNLADCGGGCGFEIHECIAGGGGSRFLHSACPSYRKGGSGRNDKGFFNCLSLLLIFTAYHYFLTL